jgi:hypothetical protein
MIIDLQGNQAVAIEMADAGGVPVAAATKYRIVLHGIMQPHGSINMHDIWQNI